MKNATLSCFSSYSYTNNGSNEAMDTGSRITSNLIAHDNSFCLCGNFYNDCSMFGVQHTVNTQSPCSIIFSGSTSMMPKQNLSNSSQGETHLNCMPVQEDIFYRSWNSISDQQSNNELQLVQNARKRSVEAPDAIERPSCGAHSLINSATKEGTENKKRPTHFQENLSKIKKEKVPIARRRSQKLTDKITALQKLVSPYGKTDTASVLLEASISIKALHHQIEELFHMISGQQKADMMREIGSNLQSRGVCLVPCVILEEL